MCKRASLPVCSSFVLEMHTVLYTTCASRRLSLSLAKLKATEAKRKRTIEESKSQESGERPSLSSCLMAAPNNGGWSVRYAAQSSFSDLSVLVSLIV